MQLDAVRTQRKKDLFGEESELQIFESTFDPSHPFQYTNSIADPMKQSCHTLEATKLMETQLKKHLIGLVQNLFGDNIQHRWVEAYFPFTHPSWELEIFYENQWMEVLGCGIVRNEILANAGPNNSIAYAFGLGLERLAMALYKIPDIRLMWSTDSGFLTQFQNKSSHDTITYKPVSLYPQCTNDISFWLPDNVTIDSFVSNDFYDLVRDIGGDIIEQVSHVQPHERNNCMPYKYLSQPIHGTLHGKS